MKFASLFSGIGGFDLGFERAGMKCIRQIEIDKYASGILENHWPNVAKNGDITNVKGQQLATADLICGGFPCQDLSVAGKRAGLDGTRSSLWYELERIIEEAAPRWVVIENVPGLFSSNKRRDFAVILEALDKRGYGVAWRRLDSQYYGLAQRRKRVFIVGSLGNTSAGKVLFEQESLSWDTAPSKAQGQGYSPISGTLSASGGGLDRPSRSGNMLDFCIPDVSNSLHTKRRDGIGPDYESQTFVVNTANTGANGSNISQGVDYTLDGANSNAVVFQQNTRNELRELRGNIAGALPAQPGMKQQNYLAWHENKSGNLAFADTARAKRSGASHSYQGVGVRRLTPQECERLQGFPDGWTEGFSDTQRYKMLGNAVSVPVAEWIARRIVEHD